MALYDELDLPQSDPWYVPDFPLEAGDAFAPQPLTIGGSSFQKTFDSLGRIQDGLFALTAAPGIGSSVPRRGQTPNGKMPDGLAINGATLTAGGMIPERQEPSRANPNARLSNPTYDNGQPMSTSDRIRMEDFGWGSDPMRPDRSFGNASSELAALRGGQQQDGGQSASDAVRAGFDWGDAPAQTTATVGPRQQAREAAKAAGIPYKNRPLDDIQADLDRLPDPVRKKAEEYSTI